MPTIAVRKTKGRIDSVSASSPPRRSRGSLNLGAEGASNVFTWGYVRPRGRGEERRGGQCCFLVLISKSMFESDFMCWGRLGGLHGYRPKNRGSSVT